MTKYLFWFGLGLLALWLVKVTGLVTAAAVFLMAGIVPGVEISIPPIPMLVLLGLLLIGVLVWVKQQRLGKQIRELKSKHQAKVAPARPRQVRSKRATPARARYSRPKAVTR